MPAKSFSVGRRAPGASSDPAALTAGFPFLFIQTPAPLCEEKVVASRQGDQDTFFPGLSFSLSVLFPLRQIV